MHADGTYVASRTRFEADYVRVGSEEELEALIRAGYGARMSSPEVNGGPSLIASQSIRISSSVSAPPTIEQLLRRFAEDGDLDRGSTSKSRIEQSFLRVVLMGGRDVGACSICQLTLPENLLVAAHIKLRSRCSKAERLDFMNVATLMCKLGCDDLFEKAYIVVGGGVVERNTARAATPHAENSISNLLGKRVPNWSGSHNYYEWHRAQAMRR